MIVIVIFRRYVYCPYFKRSIISEIYRKSDKIYERISKNNKFHPFTCKCGKGNLTPTENGLYVIFVVILKIIYRNLFLIGNGKNFKKGAIR